MRIAPMTLFVASSLGAFLLTQAGVSTAAYRQWSAAGCASANGTVLYATPAGVYHNAASNVDIMCDAPDDTTYMKSNATGVNIYGYDGSTADSVTAYTCVSYRYASGGNCGWGTLTPAAFTGEFEMPVSTSAWQTYPNDIAYVGINLPRYGYGRVRGFRMSL